MGKLISSMIYTRLFKTSVEILWACIWFETKLLQIQIRTRNLGLTDKDVFSEQPQKPTESPCNYSHSLTSL